MPIKKYTSEITLNHSGPYIKGKYICGNVRFNISTDTTFDSIEICLVGEYIFNKDSQYKKKIYEKITDVIE
ncbi:hypothetical protein A3Q56_01917, partial [Intoshia linei]